MSNQSSQVGTVNQPLVALGKDGIKIEGHRGTWYVLSKNYHRGEQVFLLEHEMWGEEAPHLIVYSNGSILMDGIHNGWQDYFDEFEGRR